MPQPRTGLQAGRLFRWQSGAVSQGFGNELDLEPVGYKKGALIYPVSVPGGRPGRFHRGVDLPLSLGTAIRAALTGQAIVPAFDAAGFGNAVLLEGARYVTTYGHLSKVSVAQLSVVIHGDLIGNSGSTGNSTGPHLHWEVFDKMLGAWIDPWLVV